MWRDTLSKNMIPMTNDCKYPNKNSGSYSDIRFICDSYSLYSKIELYAQNEYK